MLVIGPMMSIAILSLGCNGVSDIIGSSVGLIHVNFSFWQASHLFMNFSVLFNKCGILYRSFILWYVFWIPKCPVVPLRFSWYIFSIFSSVNSWTGSHAKMTGYRVLLIYRCISLIWFFSNSANVLSPIPTFLLFRNMLSIFRNHIASSNSPNSVLVNW